MAKQRLSLPGILVKIRPELGGPRFQFFICNGSPANPLFFTSPGLREILKKSKYPQGFELGYIRYSLRTDRVDEYIYPFRGTMEDIFEGKGIASGLERIITRELKKLTKKNITIYPGMLAEPVRARQQEKRGIKTENIGKGFCYDYNVSLDDLRRRINEKRKKYRKTHRLPSADALVKHMQRTGGKR